jgi:hypothetical protein
VTATTQHSAHDDAYSFTTIRHLIGAGVYVVATTRHSRCARVYSLHKIGSDAVRDCTSTLV